MNTNLIDLERKAAELASCFDRLSQPTSSMASRGNAEAEGGRLCDEWGRISKATCAVQARTPDERATKLRIVTQLLRMEARTWDGEVNSGDDLTTAVAWSLLRDMAAAA